MTFRVKKGLVNTSEDGIVLEKKFRTDIFQ